MARTLETTITSLEMRARPRLPEHHPPRGAALMRAHQPPLHFYRYLYDAVGRDYYWLSRKHMSDEELAGIIHDDRVEVYVFYVDGAPAGFVEIDFRREDRGDISFLGLMAEHIGKGYGLYLVCEAVALGWAREISLLTIETCTLDHPRALALYQRCGFTATAQRRHIVTTG